MSISSEEYKTFKVSPMYKKSTFSNEYWVKNFNGKDVYLIICTEWRWGEFNISIKDNDNNQEFLEQNPIIINDHSGEFIETTDGCGYSHEIKNIETFSEDLKKQVYEDIYEDLDEHILYDESILEEEKDWVLDDTIYEIYGGFTLEVDE